MQKEKLVWLVLVAAALVGGYFGGTYLGYNKGYKKAQADIKAVQEQAAKKAAEQAAKEANPFQAVNPLDGVSSNPFEKAKSIINPFK